MGILDIEIHNSWKAFIEAKEVELKNIELLIGSNYTPKKELVLRFLKTDLKNIKVLILGQDPYPEEGRATGRSFEVGDLKSWNQKFRQVSLKNIIRLIHKNYMEIDSYESIFKYSEIIKQIENNEFKIEAPNELFKSWEEEGVLMLNSYFTCQIGKPGSHRSVWESFARDLISYIDEVNSDLKWFLWGKEAQSFKSLIVSGKIIESRHPMMCSNKYDDDFLKFEGFKITKNEINWLGK